VPVRVCEYAVPTVPAFKGEVVVMDRGAAGTVNANGEETPSFGEGLVAIRDGIVSAPWLYTALVRIVQKRNAQNIAMNGRRIGVSLQKERLRKSRLQRPWEAKHLTGKPRGGVSY
jgi:hypothetical protein